MKKSIVISIIATLFLIFFCINISYANEIDLKGCIDDKIIRHNYYGDEWWYEEYFHDYDKGSGENDYGKYDFSNSTGWDLSVNYYWLHNLVDLVNAINDSSLSAQDIADSNEKEAIEYAQRILDKSRYVLETFAYVGKHVTSCEDLSNWTQVINTKRSRAAFRNITGFKEGNYVKDYINYMDKALRKINAAYDIKKGKSENYAGMDGNKIDINDNYETKFRYTYEQIYAYTVRIYGNDYNVGEKNYIIKKVWDAKLGLYKEIHEGSQRSKYEKFEDVLTDTNLYVDKSDSYETKMSYSIEQIWLYLQVFGDDFGVEKDKEDIISVEWQNMLATGNHTAFYNKHSLHNGPNTSFLGGDDANPNYTQDQIKDAKTSVQGDITDVTVKGQEYYNDHENDFSNDISSVGVETEQERAAELEESYHHPTKVGDDDSTGTADEAMQNANDFIDSGSNDKIDSASLQDLSNSIYNIALIAGIVIAVLVGAILGIKFMTGSVEEKADVKKLLIPYVVGCVVIFGAFGIWKLVVTILSNI